AVMELVNALYTVDLDAADDELKKVVLFSLENTLLLLSPIIPHFCEELFKRLGKTGSIVEHAWPEYRKDSLKTDEVLVVVQINGKLRSKFTIMAESDEALIRETALADEKIKKNLGDKEPKKVIIIRKKQTLVNIVV
ncbi:MAG: leucine--tRNA ligase, partial [Deltaproteobacteria bacterium]